MSREGIILAAGEGKILPLGDSEIAFKLTGEHAVGLSVFELRVAPGSQTLAHVHRKMEELFYVLEGELDFQTGGPKVRSAAGTFVFVPPGVVHAVSNPSTKPARMLVIVSPPGFERYFEELSQVLAGEGPPDLAVIAELRNKYDTDHLDTRASES